MQTKHVAELVHNDAATLLFNLRRCCFVGQPREHRVTQLLVEALQIPDCLQTGPLADSVAEATCVDLDTEQRVLVVIRDGRLLV